MGWASAEASFSSFTFSGTASSIVLLRRVGGTVSWLAGSSFKWLEGAAKSPRFLKAVPATNAAAAV